MAAQLMFRMQKLSHSVALLGSMLVFTAIDGVSVAEEPLVVEIAVSERDGIQFPNRARIKSIDAELYNCQEFLGKMPPVPRFAIPAQHYDDILEFFEDPRIDHRPNPDLPEIGMLRITLVDGSIASIPFYSHLGKGPLEFSIKGIRCLNSTPQFNVDEAMKLDYRLRHAYYKLTGHIVTEKISP